MKRFLPVVLENEDDVIRDLRNFYTKKRGGAKGLADVHFGVHLDDPVFFRSQGEVMEFLEAQVGSGRTDRKVLLHLDIDLRYAEHRERVTLGEGLDTYEASAGTGRLVRESKHDGDSRDSLYLCSKIARERDLRELVGGAVHFYTSHHPRSVAVLDRFTRTFRPYDTGSRIRLRREPLLGVIRQKGSGARHDMPAALGARLSLDLRLRVRDGSTGNGTSQYLTGREKLIAVKQEYDSLLRASFEAEAYGQDVARREKEERRRR